MTCTYAQKPQRTYEKDARKVPIVVLVNRLFAAGTGNVGLRKGVRGSWM